VIYALAASRTIESAVPTTLPGTTAANQTHPTQNQHDRFETPRQMPYQNLLKAHAKLNLILRG